jgi:acyl-CoA synthetase (AMP-forming)/AMP-acid ligase II
VPLSWRWSAAELAHGISDSRANVLLADAENAPAARELIDAGRVPAVERCIVEGDKYDAFLGRPEPSDVTVAAGAPAVILYTGGTTGASKGVVLSHMNVMANAIDEIVDTDMEPDDVTLLIAPMYHSASLLCWFLPHLVIGACSVFMRRFDEEHAAQLIELEHVTNGFFIPNMVRRMLISGAWTRHRRGTFRRLYVGGATFRMPDKEAVREVLPDARIYYQYGLTEAGPIVTRLRPEDMFKPELDGSIGQEMLLNDVSIRDEDGTEVPDGKPGEICVRGPNVMLGYFNRPTTRRLHFGTGAAHGDMASRRDGYHARFGTDQVRRRERFSAESSRSCTPIVRSPRPRCLASRARDGMRRCARWWRSNRERRRPRSSCRITAVPASPATRSRSESSFCRSRRSR